MISIIVPVYNAVKTIERCVDSIIKQTYSDWELLLVDDGSNDGSDIICNRYTEQDSRIKVFHKENGGVSSARNVGLSNVKGDWITFIDSDDWVKDRYLENLCSHAGEGVDLVISYADVYDNLGHKLEKYPAKIVTDENFDIAFSENDLHWHVALWSKLYKTSIIKKGNLSFSDDMHVGEDVCFLYAYMIKSKKIYISSDTDYCYFDCSENSLSHSIHSLKSEMISYKNVKMVVNELIKEKNIKDNKVLVDLGRLVASHQRRILNSLYSSKLERHIRLVVLNEVDWDDYVKYIYIDSIKATLLRNLLKYKLFYFYDLIRVLNNFIKNKYAI